jgi:hypothetical protein
MWRAFAQPGLLLNVIFLLGWSVSVVTLLAATHEKSVVPTDRPVSYEAFGAVGDGVADDLPAIVEAHAFANAYGLLVKSRPDAVYHLGRRAIARWRTTAYRCSRYARCSSR